MSTRSPRAPQTFEQLVLAFLADLELNRGLARNTVDAYRGDLVQFGTFLARRGRDALTVKPAELAAFLDDWPTAGRATHRSRPRRCSARSLACARSTVSCSAAA